MKKFIFIITVVSFLFITTDCTVNDYYGKDSPVGKQDSEKIRMEAKKNAEIFSGYTQMYFSEDHEWLFIDLSIDPERGNHVTNLANEHCSWNEAKIKKAKFHILMKVNGRRICRRMPIAEIDKRNNLIRLKFSTKPFKKKEGIGKKVDFSVTLVGDGKWHFLIGKPYEESPFSSLGNDVNPDCHFGGSLLNWKVIPYENQ